MAEAKGLLRGLPAFSMLFDEELGGLAERLELVHFPLGKIVCRAGDVADALYIVYSGRARVLGAGAGGEEVTVGTLGRGDAFGEQGLLTDSRRHYTVRAADDLALLRLDRADFDRLLAMRPGVR